MAVMIKGHKVSLDKIDGVLLKQVSNEMLRKHLADTRGHVKMHLDRAQQIEASL